MNFLKYYISFETGEIVVSFEEEIKTLSNNNFTMGVEEVLLEMAEKQGLEQGKYLFVSYLLTNTNHSDEKIAAITATTVAFVREVKAEMGE